MKQLLVYILCVVYTTQLRIVVCERLPLDQKPSLIHHVHSLNSCSQPQQSIPEESSDNNSLYIQCGDTIHYQLVEADGRLQVVTRVEVVLANKSETGVQLSIELLTTGGETRKVIQSNSSDSQVLFIVSPFVRAKSVTVYSNPPSCFNVTIVTCLLDASNGDKELPNFDKEITSNHVPKFDKAVTKIAPKYTTKANQSPDKRVTTRSLPQHPAKTTTLHLSRHRLNTPSSQKGSLTVNRKPRALANTENKDITPKNYTWLQLAVVGTLSIASLAVLPTLVIMTFFCCRHKNRHHRKLADLPKRTSHLYGSSNIYINGKEKESLESIGYSITGSMGYPITDDHPLGSPTVSTFHLASCASLDKDGGDEMSGTSLPLRHQSLASEGLQNTLHYLKQQENGYSTFHLASCASLDKDGGDEMSGTSPPLQHQSLASEGLQNTLHYLKQQENGYSTFKGGGWKDAPIAYTQFTESCSTTQSYLSSPFSAGSFEPPPHSFSSPLRRDTDHTIVPRSSPVSLPPSHVRYSVPILSSYSPPPVQSLDPGCASVGASPVHVRHAQSNNKSISPIPVPIPLARPPGLSSSTSKLPSQESLGESSLDQGTRFHVGRHSACVVAGSPVSRLDSSQGETSLDRGTREHTTPADRLDSASGEEKKYAVINKMRRKDKKPTPYENPYHILDDPYAIPPPLPSRTSHTSPKLPHRSDHTTSHMTSPSNNSSANNTSPKLPRRMTSHMTSPSNNSSGSTSPKLPHRPDHITHHMTSPSTNSSANSSPGSNRRINHMTINPDHKINHMTINPDHKINHMTIEPAHMTSSSSSRTPSPKGIRRIGHISIEASSPTTTPPVPRAGRGKRGDKGELAGRGGRKGDRVRSIVRSESGESFHLVIVNESDNESTVDVNDTASADIDTTDTVILKDDAIDPKTDTNADHQDTSSDATEQRSDTEDHIENGHTTPLYHTLEPNRECPIYHELEPSDEELFSDEETSATPPLPPRDISPRAKDPVYERVASMKKRAAARGGAKHPKDHTPSLKPAVSVDSLSSEDGTYIDNKPKTLKLRPGSSTDYETIPSAASSPFYHKAASIENLVAMFESGHNPPLQTPPKLAMLKKLGSSSGSHDYETVSSFLGLSERSTSHDYASIGPVPSLEDLAGDGSDSEAPWIPEGAQRNQLLKIDSQGYASVLRPADSTEVDPLRDARSATPNMRVTDVEEAWKYQQERGYAPLTLSRKVNPKLVTKRPDAKLPQDYEVPVNILPLKRLVRQKATFSGSEDDLHCGDENAPPSSKSKRLPSHTRSDGSYPNSPSKKMPAHARSISSGGIRLTEHNDTHLYSNSSEQDLRFSSASRSKMRVKSTSDGSLNMIKDTQPDEDVFDSDHETTIVKKLIPYPKKCRAVSLSGATSVKPAPAAESSGRPRASSVHFAKVLMSSVKPPPPVKAKPARKSLPVGLRISLNQQSHVVV